MFSLFKEFKRKYKQKHPEKKDGLVFRKYTKALYKQHTLKFGINEKILKYRFYDDNPQYINDVKENKEVFCIEVRRRQMTRDGTVGVNDLEDPEYLHNPDVTPITYREHLRREYNNFENESELEMYTNKIYTLHGEEKRVSEALNEEMMDDCMLWSSLLYEQENDNPNNSNLQQYYGAVFFDFDRVINCLEGYSSYPTEEEMIEHEGVHAITLLKYIIGSPIRLQKLRNLFDFLQNKKVRACILTNNTGCHKPIFKTVCNLLHQTLTESNIFCCVGLNTKLVCIERNVSI
jgi:hypothetical protein